MKEYEIQCRKGNPFDTFTLKFPGKNLIVDWAKHQDSLAIAILESSPGDDDIAAKICLNRTQAYALRDFLNTTFEEN